MNQQARLTEIYRGSLGTPSELDAYMRLREVGRQVAAFDKWLRWVDDEDNANAPAADDIPLAGMLGQ